MIACLVLFCSPVDVAGQAPEDTGHRRDKPADATELAAIAARGRAIAAYDAAAWHATDEVQALHPKEGLVRMYIGRQTTAGWLVAFGKMNDAKDAFLLAFETTPSADPLHPTVMSHDPAVEDRGEWFKVARAFDTGRDAFGKASRPYNIVVLPVPDKSWFVYVYPAATTNDVFPTGGDVRYRVSGDGTKILDTHRMHASILEFKMDLTQKMSFHTAFLDDAPEDTDVANALMMGGTPAIIATKKFVYRIAADGTPTYVDTTEAFMKELKK